MNNNAIYNQIIEYAKLSKTVNKITVFGEDRDTTIRLSVLFNESYDVDESFSDMLIVVDELTNGKFELLIENGDCLSANTKKEVEEGEVIYET